MRQEAQARDLQNRRAGLGNGDVHIGHPVTQHGLDSAFVVEIARFENGGNLPVAHGHNAVGDAPDVRHAVRNVEDGDTAFLQPIDEGEEAFRLRDRQRRGRLVEDQEFGLVRHGARNGDQLPVGNAEIGNRAAHIEIEAHAFGNGARFLKKRAAAQAETVGGLGQAVDHQVRGDIEIRNDTVIDRLVYGHHALPDGIGRRFRPEVAAAETDRATVARMDAGEDFHQRRLACAIGAHQGRDFAAVQFEAETAQDAVVSKGLFETLDLAEIAAHECLPQSSDQPS